MTKRKIIIRDLNSNVEYNGLIKLSHSDEENETGYFIITDCPWFDGCPLSKKEKEGFKYSWVLISEECEEWDDFNKINLKEMEYFNSNDWPIDLPYNFELDEPWYEFLCIEFVKVKPENNFKKIKI